MPKSGRTELQRRVGPAADVDASSTCRGKLLETEREAIALDVLTLLITPPLGHYYICYLH